MPSSNPEDTVADIDLAEMEAPMARLEQMQDDVLQQLDHLNAQVLSLIGDAMRARASEPTMTVSDATSSSLDSGSTQFASS